MMSPGRASPSAGQSARCPRSARRRRGPSGIRASACRATAVAAILLWSICETPRCSVTAAWARRAGRPRRTGTIVRVSSSASAYQGQRRELSVPHGGEVELSRRVVASRALEQWMRSAARRAPGRDPPSSTGSAPMRRPEEHDEPHAEAETDRTVPVRWPPQPPMLRGGRTDHARSPSAARPRVPSLGMPYLLGSDRGRRRGGRSPSRRSPWRRSGRDARAVDAGPRVGRSPQAGRRASAATEAAALGADGADAR